MITVLMETAITTWITSGVMPMPITVCYRGMNFYLHAVILAIFILCHKALQLGLE